MPRVSETIDNFLRFVDAGDAELMMHSYGPVIDLNKTSDRDSRYTCYIIFLIWGIPSVPTFRRLKLLEKRTHIFLSFIMVCQIGRR